MRNICKGSSLINKELCLHDKTKVLPFYKKKEFIGLPKCIIVEL